MGQESHEQRHERDARKRRTQPFPGGYPPKGAFHPDIQYLTVNFDEGTHVEVAFAVLPNYCDIFDGLTVVYSGTRRRTTTTINCVEEITREICEKSRLEIRAVAFYDLQTHLGHDLPCGIYGFDAVTGKIHDGSLHEPRWDMKYCPPEIYRSFLPLIGEPHSALHEMRLAFPRSPEPELQALAASLVQEQSRLDKAAKEQIKSWRADLMTPDQALAQDYMLLQNRYDLPDESSPKTHQVVVDSKGYPHLRNLCGERHQTGRFSLWGLPYFNDRY